MDVQRGSVLIVLFAVSGFFFWQAHINGNEKIHPKYYLSIIPYFAFYYLLKGAILMATTFSISANRFQKPDESKRPPTAGWR